MEKNELISQPDMKRSLFPHQLRNIFHMEELEKNRRVNTKNGYLKTKLGILSDKTGYGKTACVVGLMVRDKKSWDLDKVYNTKSISQFSNNNTVIYRTIKPYKKVKCNLVLVPPSIVTQWEEELSFSNLKFISITQLSKVSINIEEYDVVLVNTKIFNKFINVNRNMAWKRFIFDEPGNIKVTSMNEVVADFYWFVTATVGKIYPLHEKCGNSFMKSFITGYNFEWLNIQNLVIRNDEEYLQKSFTSAKVIEKNYPVINLTYNLVKNYTSEIISQMVSAGNIRGAIHALGGQETNNIFELLKKEKIGKKVELENKLKSLAEGTNKYKKTVLMIRTQIEKINGEIQHIEKKYEEILKTDCMICYEPLKNPIMEGQCGRVFCGGCLLTWIKENNNCPLCKGEISQDKLCYINNGDTSEIKPLEDKIDILLRIIREKPEGKFIIFSSWDQSFKNIIENLEKNNVTFTQLKGRENEINIRIRDFKKGKYTVLLLNATCNGAGLNLQEATDIILYHEMDELTKIQAIGRINRIGRIDDIYVHQLLYR